MEQEGNLTKEKLNIIQRHVELLSKNIQCRHAYTFIRLMNRHLLNALYGVACVPVYVCVCVCVCLSVYAMFESRNNSSKGYKI